MKRSLTRSSLPYMLCGLILLATLLFSTANAKLLLASSSSPEVAAQATISVTSELVRAPLSVTDARGNFIEGLTQQNFQVFEDGRLQKLTWFQREDAPVSVGLVVDHSGSMGSKLPSVAAALFAFAQTANSEDEMFVVNFGDEVSVDLPGDEPFTSNPREIEKEIGAISASGRTALYDAVAEGLTHLQLAKWRKTALIVVSDGGDNASKHKYPEILAMARESQTVIYSIGLLDESGEDENAGVLVRLCKDTGGLAFFPGAKESIAGAMIVIAGDLREEYMLGYVPQTRSANGSFRKIRVKVRAPGKGKLRIRTRPGYVLPSASNTPPSIETPSGVEPSSAN